MNKNTSGRQDEGMMKCFSIYTSLNTQLQIRLSILQDKVQEKHFDKPPSLYLQTHAKKQPIQVKGEDISFIKAIHSLLSQNK